MRHAVAACVLLSLLAAAPLRAQDPPPPEQPPPGQQPAAPEQPAPPPVGPEGLEGVSWFPLQVSRRWQYRVTFSIESTAGETHDSGQATHALDVYVAEPQVIEGRQAAVLEWKLDGDLAQRCYFVTREEVLYCVKRIQGFGEHMKEFLLVDPQPTAREDLAVGDEWVWQGKAGPTPGRQTFKIVREEEVVTPAGTFRALVMQIEFEGEDESRGTTTRWLVKGTGIVREVSEVRTATSVFRTEGVLMKAEGGRN